MKRTRVLLPLLTLPLLIVLSGCMRLITDYEIVSPDEINVHVDFGVQNQALEEMGTDTATEDMCTEADFSDVPGAIVEEYSEEGPEGYTGCRVNVTSTAAELSSAEARIELVDGVWHFSQTGDDAAETEGMSPEETAELFSDFRISVTFPGKVLTHNGSSTVDGTTVTWTDPLDLMSPEGFQATAEAAGSPDPDPEPTAVPDPQPGEDADRPEPAAADEGGGFPVLPVVIGGVLLLVVAAAVVAIVMTRRKKTPPAGPPAGGAPPPGAPGPQGEPPAGQWAPQPGQPSGRPDPSGQQQAGRQWGQPPQAPPADQLNPWAQQPQQPGQDQWGQSPNQQWGQQPGQPPQQSG